MSGSAFVDTSTYTRVIGNAGDAHSYIADVDRFEVELRPLDSGDRAKVRDGLALREDGASALGTVELLSVRAALISWTLPGSPGTMLERLRPDVLEAIREHVAYGKEPPAPLTKAELDAQPARATSAEAFEAAARQRADLEADELREGEEPAVVPLER